MFIRSRAAIWILLITVLSACAGPQLMHTQLSVLDKGLPPEEVASRLKLNPRSTHSVSLADRHFEFHRYRLYNGLYADNYWLAYENNKLVYWGYVSEFRRQRDQGLDISLTNVLARPSAN